jgi:hypothetical protein
LFKLSCFLKIKKVGLIFGLLFSKIKAIHYLCKKMAWATFWAIFSHTRLVTLCWWHQDQGCQMAYFQTKIWVHFGRSCNWRCCYISWPFDSIYIRPLGISCGHLVNFMVIW